MTWNVFKNHSYLTNTCSPLKRKWFKEAVVNTMLKSVPQREIKCHKHFATMVEP